MFDHSRASSAQAQCGWQVSWVWWHQSGFESVDEGVPIFVNPVLLCVVTVMQNYFLGDVIWAEGTVGWWTCKQMRHRPFWKWKYFIYVPWVLSQLWAPGKCPFSCLRSGIKNEGGSSYSRISLKLRKACSDSYQDRSLVLCHRGCRCPCTKFCWTKSKSHLQFIWRQNLAQNVKMYAMWCKLITKKPFNKAMR